MSWLDCARSAIEDVHATLPADASLKQRRSALNAAAERFHMGTSWGRKVWSRAAREYLERHGLAPRNPRDASPQSKLYDRLKSGDVVLMGQLTQDSRKEITNP